MRTHRTLLVALILPLLMASVVVAQGIPTSTILGRVINEGQGLPGVTVTAKSPALQGTRTAVTSTNGDFVFPNVPPGEYTISFTMSGFQTVARSVKANASQQSVLNVTMSLAAVAAEAVVVGTSESISQTQTAATTVSTDLTMKLPVTRTLLSAVLLTPGVSASGPNGNTTISGGTSFDNLFTVNGVNIQDNIRGTPNNLFIEDAIAETTTSVAAISAEFGRFTGGVVNAITKSGGNSFSGSARATLDNDDWASKRPLTTVEPTDKINPTYEGTLGGPIWKDRIWFFLAGRYQETEVSNQTFGTNIPYTSGNTDQRWEAKGTFTPFQNHTLTASYMNLQTAQVNRTFRPAYDLNSVFTPHLPQELLALNYNGVITDKFFVEAQYSQRKFTFKDYGATTKDLLAGTAMYDMPAGQISFNSPTFCGVCDPENRDNENIVLKGTYFLSTKSLGSHNIVLGYDDFTGQRKSNNYQSGSNYSVYVWGGVIKKGQDVFPVIDNSSYLVYWPILQQAEKSDVRTSSLFVNDTWRLSNNLSFNIGIRYDKNKAVDSRGFVGSDDSAFSPRLGATWDVKGDGRFRVGASYARYVGAVQENYIGASSSAGSPAIYLYYYEGPTINGGNPASPLTPQQALEAMYRWFGITGTNQFPTKGNTSPEYVEVPGVSTQIPESLASTYTDEFTLSFSGALGNRGNYRVDGVYREFGDFIADQVDRTTGTATDSLGYEYDLTNVVNTDVLERKYAALNLQANYRFWSSLNVGANYTWSHTYGNVTNETGGSGPVRSGALSYPEYFDATWNNPSQSSSQDQRHRARIYATYDVPLPKVLGALNLSAIWQFDSGLPYGAAGTVDTRPYVTNPGYLTPPTSVNYWFQNRNTFKTDDINRTDLALNYSYFLGPVEIFIQPQVQNVFMNEHVTTVNTTVETKVTRKNDYAAFNPFTTAPTQGARGTGANWNYGPSFGKPTAPSSYQAPRLFRIGMGIRF
jgi:outer membrane receptor for ferrienterochelin and colicin